MRNFLLAVLLFAAVISCNKDNLPDAPGETLVTIDYDMGGALYSEALQYDAQNRLSQLISPGQKVHELQYNAQGQLSGIIYKDIALLPGQVIHSSQFSYDANGHIIKKLTTSGAAIVKEVNYTYNTAGRLIADTQYQSGNAPRYNTYTYDSKGNIERLEEFRLIGGVFTSNGVFTFEYDNKLSPYHKTGQLLYYLNEHPNYLFKSNILRSSYNGVHTGRTYMYEYYSNGTIRTVIYNDPQPFGGTARIRYTYVQP